MNITRYLDRIGLDKATPNTDAAGLRLLQRQHLLTVPFENLDIHWKRPISIDTNSFYTKIVDKRRGGFCYELNGLFDELLRSLGFETRIISARVFDGSAHGPEYDHLAVIVSVEGERFLADVGFGDFTSEPLRLAIDEKQTDSAGEFIIRRYVDDHLEVAKLDGDGWRSQYIFRDIARDLAEFAEMCTYQQTSPDSHFTRGKVCSIMTPTGRRTLTDNKFLITDHGRRDEREIKTAGEFDEVLNDEFGIRQIQ